MLDLRQAVNLANVLNGAAMISFDPAVFNSAQTITLSSGQLELSDKAGNETITGPAAGVTLSGGGNSRVFQVDGGVTATLSGLTITGTLSGQNGGGLFNQGGATLNLNNCNVSASTASSGGGLYNDGTANLTSCDLSNNMAQNYGGGLYNTGTANLTNCSVQFDSATYHGGGLYNSSGTATLTNCTVSNDTAGGRWRGTAAACTMTPL